MPNSRLLLFLSTLLWCLVFVAFSRMVGSADDSSRPCIYDTDAPSLESAKISLGSLNYECAELELKDLLKASSLAPELKADAHRLLAATYFGMYAKDSAQRRGMTLPHLIQAHLANRSWSGELDPKSPGFIKLWEEAKWTVDSASPPPATVAHSNCPRLVFPLVGTGVFVASTLWYIAGSNTAEDDWHAYEASGGDPGLYDTYVSSNRTRKWAGGTAIVSGAVCGYLWWRYLAGKRGCENSSTGGLTIHPASDRLVLTYTF
ncbi:MAG: hypothetical protein JSU65_03865 [Candidatus Zixiibacteriota bacterium]|nr:MAG: hypothetical protein JSU65_03865 [candidate division Zixibacteria bacterium]